MSSQTCRMEVPPKGKAVTWACSTFRSKFVYRCKKVSLPGMTGQPPPASQAELSDRAAVGSRGGHADLGAISSAATDPSFHTAGRWTWLHVAPLPLWSAS